jgi:hypothetical protein
MIYTAMAAKYFGELPGRSQNYPGQTPPHGLKVSIFNIINYIFDLQPR